MDFHELFDLLDDDVYLDLVKRVNMKRFSRDLAFVAMNREFRERLWISGLLDAPGTWDLDAYRTARRVHMGRFMLRKPTKVPTEIDKWHSLAEIDCQNYTVPDKYWIGGRLLKPNDHADGRRAALPPLGFSLFLNSNDLEAMKKEIGKDNVKELIQYVKSRYPEIQSHGIVQKAIYLHYAHHYENDFDTLKTARQVKVPKVSPAKPNVLSPSASKKKKAKKARQKAKKQSAAARTG